MVLSKIENKNYVLKISIIEKCMLDKNLKLINLHLYVSIVLTAIFQRAT